jgi:hypothetical protein
VHANAAGIVIADQPRLFRFCDVVDLEAAVFVARSLEFLEHAQVVRGHAQSGGEFGAARLALELVCERGARRGKLLGPAADPAHVALVIDHHDAVCDAHLVAVRGRIVDHDACRHARTPRIGDLDNRGAEAIRVGKMADKGVSIGDRDLAGAGEIEVSDEPYVAGEGSFRPVNNIHRRFRFGSFSTKSLTRGLRPRLL